MKLKLATFLLLSGRCFFCLCLPQCGKVLAMSKPVFGKMVSMKWSRLCSVFFFSNGFRNFDCFHKSPIGKRCSDQNSLHKSTENCSSWLESPSILLLRIVTNVELEGMFNFCQNSSLLTLQSDTQTIIFISTFFFLSFLAFCQLFEAQLTFTRNSLLVSSL